MEIYDKPRQCIQKQRHHFADKGPCSQRYGPVVPVVIYECESWTTKKTECQIIDALNFGAGENSSEPLGQQGDQTNQTSIPWIFTRRTDAEAEALIHWAPDVKRWLIGKDPDVGKGWQLEEKGVTEDKMVGWLHRLNGREFEESLGDSEGQQNLVCCGPCGRKKSDTT